jgi:hypothetical protein
MGSSAGKIHWQKFRIVYLSIACAMLLTLLYFFPSEEKGVSRPVLAIAKPARGSSLVATLENNILNGASADTITFEAAADPGTAIENMTVCVHAPEFTFQPENGCIPVRVYSKGDAVVPHTPVAIQLIPKDTSGSFKVLVSASWTRYVPSPQAASPGKHPAGKATIACSEDPQSCVPIAEKQVMTLGPIKLGIDKWRRFFSRLWRFLKDLSLPIILIVLANWLSAKSAKDDEEKQIAHILLPKVMRLSGHYYLPLTLNAAIFVDPSGPAPGTPAELSFCLMSFFLVARSLKETEGAVFFKDRAAERIFALANNMIRERVLIALGDRNGDECHFTECLNHLGSRVPAGERRWPRTADRPAAAVPASWDKLENWLKNMPTEEFQAIRFLFHVLAEVVRFESNAPYTDWYTNSLTANVFELDEDIRPPKNNVFGQPHVKQLELFHAILHSYRQGKGSKARASK